MRSLFWLQQQHQTKAKMMVDPTTALKTIKSVEDVDGAETLQNFPICSALSPSAKSLKIPVSAYSSSGSTRGKVSREFHIYSRGMLDLAYIGATYLNF